MTVCPRALVALVCGASVFAAAPVKLIIDTDAGFDVDDVGAISIGNALQDSGEAEIVAVGHTNGFTKGIGGVSALMAFYGRGGVPLGAYKGPWARDPNAGKGTADRYLSDLVGGYPRVVGSSAEVNDTVMAYRRVLSAQPDHSVHIASIGITTNMRDLVQSRPDAHSPLGGAQLIAQKVKLVVWMDMMYNFGCAQHDSADWLGSDKGCRGSAQAAVMGWPPSVKQLFMPLGGDVTSGDWLTGCAGLGNPVRQAYEDWAGPSNGRWSWDPIAVMIAVRGVGGVHCEEYNAGQGHMEVNAAGEEDWVPGSVSNQSRVRYAGADAQSKIAFELNQLMCKPPGPWSNETWTQGAGMNCYGPRGTSPGHGATDLESPPASSCGQMTLARCQQRCVDTPGCTSISVKPAANGMVSCYRKSDVSLGLCDAGTSFSTYTRREWVLVRGFNCWPGHGARNVGGSPSLGTMDVRDCQQKCEQTAGCSAIVWEGKPHSGVGGCYAKADVVLAKCDKGTVGFDTYVAYRVW